MCLRRRASARPTFSRTRCQAGCPESYMRIAVPTEAAANEARVAATPETVKKLIALGAEVVVQAGAGKGSGLPDADFEKAGATIAADAAATLAGADVVLAVRRPQ